jgi:hypothetical protein
MNFKKKFITMYLIVDNLSGFNVFYQTAPLKRYRYYGEESMLYPKIAKNAFYILI